MCAQKPEILKTRWPSTPCWIFVQTWITREVYIPLSTNLYDKLCLCTLQTSAKKWNFANSKMAAGLQLKFTTIPISSKRFVRNGPNLAGITHSAPTIGICDQTFWISKPNMAACRHLKYTKNSITPKPFARLSQNFNPSLVSATQ